MREILFKAKRIDKREWVESGSIIQFLDNGVRSFYMPQFNTECTCTHDNLTGDILGLINCRFYKVDPETVCQYTGLTDNNGKKIWENDICDRKEKYPEIVKYHDGDWTLDYSYASNSEIGFNYCNLGFYVTERNCVEVIGNIFDNPELLEVKK